MIVRSQSQCQTAIERWTGGRETQMGASERDVSLERDTARERGESETKCVSVGSRTEIVLVMFES